MERSKVILWAVTLAILGAIAPVFLMAWLSWHSALDDEQARLRGLADQVIERTTMSLDTATQALKSLSPLVLMPCSPDHIAAMRRLTINVQAVDEVGYFEHGLLKCTSWGHVDRRIEERHGDFVIDGGLEVILRVVPLLTDADPMMVIQYGAHNVLVHAGRFTDVLGPAGLHLTLARDDGTIVSQAGKEDPERVASVLAGLPVPQDEDAPRSYANVRHDGWVAVVSAPREHLMAYVHHRQEWMLPLGAFMSLFIVGLVVRQSRRRFSPAMELQTAVNKREFVVHYQPIIALSTGRCIGAEALVRWRRPDDTLVRPDLFIPLAEETGLIRDITDQVIETVVADLQHVLSRDRSLHVAINLCADDIRTGRVLTTIARTLQGTGVRPEQIWLEATERGFMDITSARVTLARAREMGHATAIDDFGTGYSSLQYLQGLPMDALKIDKSFVSTIGTDAVSSHIISHIIDLAKSLNMFIVAEGVERQQQADYLTSRGVDFVQGWLYAKPMPPTDFLKFYQNTLVRTGPGPELLRSERLIEASVGV